MEVTPSNVINFRRFRIERLLHQSSPWPREGQLLPWDKAWKFLYDGLASLTLANVVRAWRMLEHFLAFLNATPAVKRWGEIPGEMYLNFAHQTADPVRTLDFVYFFYRYLRRTSRQEIPREFMRIYRGFQVRKSVPKRSYSSEGG